VPAQFFLVALLLTGCAGAPRRNSPADPGAAAAVSQSEGCLPLFRSGMEDQPPERRSCWHRLWEVPTALVVYPVAIGVIVGLATAPVWLPIVALR
jgi:hypothetical protein